MDEQCVKFIVIGACTHKVNQSFAMWLRNKFQPKKYIMRANKKLIYYKEDIRVMGKQGVLAELPFTEEEIKELPNDYLKDYIEKILEVYDFSTCYLRNELSFLSGPFHMEKKWMFSYLLFKEGLFLFLEQNGISKKQARFVVVDSGDKKILLILQTIIEYANYLTIVTDRKEYFSEIVDVVYEETGLMVNVESASAQKRIIGNTVINLDRGNHRLYTYFEENACVIDLEFNREKLTYLANRRKDLNILYDYEIVINGEELDKELAAEVLTRDNWKLSRFVKMDGGCLTANEIEFILEYYQIQIEKLKTVSSVMKNDASAYEPCNVSVYPD